MSGETEELSGLAGWLYAARERPLEGRHWRRRGADTYTMRCCVCARALVLSSRVVRAGEAARRCGQQALVRCPCSQTLSYDPPPSMDGGEDGHDGEEGGGNDTVNGGNGGKHGGGDGDREDGRGVAPSVGVERVERGAAVYDSERGTVTGGVGSVEPVQTAPPLPWSDSPYVITWALLRERE